MKLVINRCYGGFGLSIAAQNLYASNAGFELFHYVQTKYKHRDGVEKHERLPPGDGNCSFVNSYKSDQGDSFETNSNADYWSYYDLDRADPHLIAAVEELGEKANGDCANSMISLKPVVPGSPPRIDMDSIRTTEAKRQ